MPPNPFVFEREDNGDRIELRTDDLPEPPFQLGGSVDETARTYASGETSVQVHGIDPEPISLSGVVDETWNGREGSAQTFVERLNAMAYSGALVRFEWGEHQRWGTFDGTAEVVYEDRVEYQIEFRPHFRRPPEHADTLTFAPAPPDEGAKVEGVIEEAQEPAPDGVNQNFAAKIEGALERALDRVTKATQRLRGVASYAELPADLLKSARRTLRAAARTLEGVAEECRTRPTLELSSGGAADFATGDWQNRTASNAERVRREVLEYIRSIERELSGDQERTHVVARGDTLQRLADKHLGDFSRWTEIADLNDLETTDLEVGQELEIPPE